MKHQITTKMQRAADDAGAEVRKATRGGIRITWRDYRGRRQSWVVEKWENATRYYDICQFAKLDSQQAI